MIRTMSCVTKKSPINPITDTQTRSPPGSPRLATSRRAQDQEGVGIATGLALGASRRSEASELQKRRGENTRRPLLTRGHRGKCTLYEEPHPSIWIVIKHNLLIYGVEKNNQESIKSLH